MMLILLQVFDAEADIVVMGEHTSANSRNHLVKSCKVFRFFFEEGPS